MDIVRSDQDAYKDRTYEELSKDFRSSYSRAVDLIPLMYNRLTLVDGLKHKAALKKIHDDHADLMGFTVRNVYRHLPKDNPNVPHRLMTDCHKNSGIETSNSQNLSCDELDVKYSKTKDGYEPISPSLPRVIEDKSELGHTPQDRQEEEPRGPRKDTIHEQSYDELLKQNKELTCELSDLREKHKKVKAKLAKLTEALSQSSFKKANNMPSNTQKAITLDLQKHGAKLFAALKSSKNSNNKVCYLDIDKNGNVISIVIEEKIGAPGPS
jgi:hypothetical protein